MCSLKARGARIQVLGRVRARCHFWNSLADFHVIDTLGEAPPPRVSRTRRASELESGKFTSATLKTVAACRRIQELRVA